MRMPMFIIQQIQRIQSMDETAQNAPVGIGVMNGKSRHAKQDAYNLFPFISNEVSDVSFCMEQIANAINIVGHLYGSMSFRSQSQLFYPR